MNTDIEDTARRVLEMESGAWNTYIVAAPDLAREVLRLLAVEKAARAYRHAPTTFRLEGLWAALDALAASEPDDERGE